MGLGEEIGLYVSLAFISTCISGVTSFGDAIMFHILASLARMANLTDDTTEVVVWLVTLMGSSNLPIMLYQSRLYEPNERSAIGGGWRLRACWTNGLAISVTGLALVPLGSFLLFSVDPVTTGTVVGSFFFTFSVGKLTEALWKATGPSASAPSPASSTDLSARSGADLSSEGLGIALTIDSREEEATEEEDSADARGAPSTSSPSLKSGASPSAPPTASSSSASSSSASSSSSSASSSSSSSASASSTAGSTASDVASAPAAADTDRNVRFVPLSPARSPDGTRTPSRTLPSPDSRTALIAVDASPAGASFHSGSASTSASSSASAPPSFTLKANGEEEGEEDPCLKWGPCGRWFSFVFPPPPKDNSAFILPGAMRSRRNIAFVLAFAGIFAGVLGGMLGVNGPPIMTAFALIRLHKDDMRASFVLYSMLETSIRIALYVNEGDSVVQPSRWLLYILLVLASWLGFLVGSYLRSFVNTERVVYLLLMLVFASSCLQLNVLADETRAIIVGAVALAWLVVLVVLAVHRTRCRRGDPPREAPPTTPQA